MSIRIPYVPVYYPGQYRRPFVPYFGPIKDYTQQKPKKPADTGVLNFSDPTEINSLADVILNEAALDKKFHGGFYDIPLLGDIGQRIVGLGDYLWNATLKPISKGQWDAAGLNLLNNVTETLDVLSNPVKGLIMEGPEGFVKGLGLFSDKGRTNYMWDIKTGAGGVVDFIANFGAEFLSDPLNWVTFGGAAIGKGAAKGLLREGLEESAETLGRQFAKEGMEAVAKNFGDEFTQQIIKEFGEEITEDLIPAVGRRLAEEIIAPEYIDDVSKLATKIFFKSKAADGAADFGAALKEAADLINKRAFNPEVYKAFGEDIGAIFQPSKLTKDVIRITKETVENSIAARVLNGVKGLVNITDKFQNMLFKGALYSSGFGFAWKAGKSIIHDIWELMHSDNVMRATVEPFVRNNTVPLNRIEEAYNAMGKAEASTASFTKYANDLSDDLYSDVTNIWVATERSNIYDALKLKTEPKDIMDALNKYSLSQNEKPFREYIEELDVIAKRIKPEQGKLLQSHVEYLKQILKDTDSMLDTLASKSTITSLGKLIKNMRAARDAALAVPASAGIYANKLWEAVSKFPQIASKFDETINDLAVIPLVKFQNGMISKEQLIESILRAEDVLETYSKDLQASLLNVPSVNKSVMDLVDKQVDAVFADIKALTDKLNALNKNKPLAVNTDVLDVLGDTVTYNIKVSHIGAALRLYYSKDIDTLIDLLSSDSYLTSTLASLSKGEGAVWVKELKNTMSGIQLFKDMLQFISNSPDLATFGLKETNMLKVALIDTLMTYSDRPLKEVVENLEFYKAQIKERLTNQINSFQKHKLGIKDMIKENALEDELAAELQRIDPALVKDGKPIYHDARTDVIATELLNKRILKTEALPDAKRIYIDFETTGLNLKGGDNMIQVACKVEDGPVFNLQMKIPDRFAPQSELVLREMGFKDAKDFVLNWNKVANCESETEGLVTLMDWLYGAKEEFGKIQICGQNIDSFDIAFLRNKLKGLGDGSLESVLDDMINDIPTFDTYRAFQKKYGYFNLDAYPETSKAIDSIIDNYVIRRRYITADSELLPKFAQQADKYTAFRMKHLADMIDKQVGAIGSESSAMLRNTAQNLLENLSDIKSMNLAWRDLLYIKENIPALTEDFDILQRLFHINQLVAESPEHFAMVSSKITNNMPIIRQYFEIGKISSAGEIAVTVSEPATRIGRSINKIRSTINNLDPLTDDIWEQYIRVGEDLKAYLKQNFPKNKDAHLWDALRLHGDNVKDTVAVVEYLYKQAQARTRAIKQVFDLDKLYSKLTGLATDNPVDKAIALLKKPETLRYTLSENKYYTYAGIDADQLWRLVIKDDVVDAAAAAKEYNDLAAGCRYQEDMLKKFGQAMDEKKMYRYSSQGNVAVQLKLMPVLREALEKLSNLTEGMNYEAKLALKEAIIEYSNNKQLSNIFDVLKMNTDELQAHLWHRGLGLIRMDLKQFYSDETVRTLVEQFLLKEKEFSEAAIKLRFIDNTLYIFPDKEYVDAFKHLPAPEKFAQDLAVPAGKLPKDITDAIDNLYTAINEVTNNGAYRSTGSVLTRANMEDLYRSVPKDIRKELIDLDDIVTINPNTGIPHNLFSDTRFDYSNLGDVLGRKIAQPYRSTNIVKDYFNTVQSLMLYADAATKTRTLFFSPDAMNTIENLFKGMSDAEAVENILAHPEYKVAMLAIDESSEAGYVVQHIPIIDEESVRYAKEVNAILVPETTYNMIFKITRNEEITNPFAKFFSKYIVDPTKAGFLSSIGLLMRNAIDSTFKNLLSTDGITDFAGFIKHTFQTVKWLRIYDDDIKEIILLGEKLAYEEGLKNTGLMYKKAVEAYFAIPENAARKEIFELIHNFIMEGSSAGITKSTLEALQNAGRLQNSDIFTTLLWKNPITKPIMSANSFIEQASRLSKYTWEIMNGESTVSAMSRVIRTHFDYSTKTKAQMYMELVVPFSTFMFNNVKFWIDLLSRHGWVASLAKDIFIPLSGMYTYDQYELQNNRSLQYMILNGNLVLDDKSNMTLKLSPSLLDAFNLLLDPIGVTNRIIAPIRVPVSGAIAALEGKEFDWQKEAATNLPFIGPTLQRYWGLGDDQMDAYDKGSAIKAADRTGDLLPMIEPSLFGSVQRSYYFSYGGNIYMTHNQNKYVEHLLNGARAVRTQEDAERAYREGVNPSQYTPRIKTSSIRKAYVKRAYVKTRRSRRARRSYARKYYAKRSYPRKKAYFHGTYALHKDNIAVFNRVMASARNTQMKMPGSYRNVAYTAPALYRRLFTGTGTDKYKVRLMPITAQTIQYRLRQDWAYLR